MKQFVINLKIVDVLLNCFINIILFIWKEKQLIIYIYLLTKKKNIYIK